MENFLISNRDVINGVAGVIFEMHPYHAPENIGVIIEAIDKWFKENDKKSKDNTRFVRFDSDESFREWIHDFLMGIKAFRDLNISRKLKEAGVRDSEDPRNQGMKLMSRYTVETEDSRYDDFIDLWACSRNISRQILNIHQSDEDCFLCKFAKEYGTMTPSDCEECNSCICNDKIGFNRVPHPMSLKPYNEWTEEERHKYSIR